METLEEIWRRYEEAKRELLHRAGRHESNGAMKAPRGEKHYVEKTVLRSLHRVISSYCSLVMVHTGGRHPHGTKKGKGGPKNGEKRRSTKNTCENRWIEGAANDELARRVAEKRAIQRRHIERVKRFVKTDRSIGTFGKYVERVFRFRGRGTYDGGKEQVDGFAAGERHTEEAHHVEISPPDGYKRLPKRRIQISLEKDVHFGLFLGEVVNFLQVLLHRKSPHEHVQANYVKENPPRVSSLTSEGRKNWWSRMLSEGGRANLLGAQTPDVKKLPAQKGRVTPFAENPHGGGNSRRETSQKGEEKHEGNSNGEERRKRNRNDPFGDPPGGVNTPLPLMDMSMSMQLWSSLLDGNHHPHNCLIRGVDPNLLYVIDSDRDLLRVLFFFKTVHLFVAYVYVTICRSETLLSCLSVFWALNRSFHGTFKLSSTGATEWKNAYAFFCAFASMLRRDILPPARGGSQVSGGSDVIRGSDVTGVTQQEEAIPEGDTPKGMHNHWGGNSHLVHCFGGLCFTAGGEASPGSHPRRGAPPEGPNSQAHGKGKSKKEQIGAPPDGQYCYYATVKNDDDIDSVNLAMHVTNTSKDNIRFYKRYIQEHIQRGFLRVYKLSETKKRTYSSEKNKEGGISRASMFKNYGQLFRNFLQEIVS
ncbi:conserved Plasmodium protein, unknown function [Plasmodium vivax]|uniref:Uncharacterized protein n=2 Tax=Plasmodium vivax TaxID=5855 RepID=A5K714_PLAVS|nr:hypothetical protein, conserved [Plasmodium vivax]EDL45105.1 hypothetical protein, conserved [Plasmodium vivax]CAI7719739.1 conserved Plasmodium protein, unknown function [Plasmodium vivax]SCO66620.1 conserved Plasmodium protein, unknown function [Plasmodium vivax]SCO72052.1 conserved Plasmodium protein, unknown function [Plasmodium vivax]|eukprot:XP_001614832.1 hypothetical protein [Plasmodium vivax Sal-1]